MKQLFMILLLLLLTVGSANAMQEMIGGTVVVSTGGTKLWNSLENTTDGSLSTFSNNPSLPNPTSTYLEWDMTGVNSDGVNIYNWSVWTVGGGISAGKIVLEASTDNVTWTTMKDFGTSLPGTYASELGVWENVKYVRFNISCSSCAGVGVNFYEISLFGDTVKLYRFPDFMTGYTEGRFKVWSPNATMSGRDLYKAFDNLPVAVQTNQMGFEGGVGATASWTVYMGDTAVNVSKLYMISINAGAQPSKFRIYGSNDNSSWTLLHNQSQALNHTDLISCDEGSCPQYGNFTFSETTGFYKYYRYNSDAATGGNLYIYDMALWGYNASFTAPVIDETSWNFTSAFLDSDQDVWQTNPNTTIKTRDGTPTVKFSTDIASDCAMNTTAGTYEEIGSGGACSGAGTTSHTCTLPASMELLVDSGVNYLYPVCVNTQETSFQTNGSALNVTFDQYTIRGKVDDGTTGIQDVNVTAFDQASDLTTLYDQNLTASDGNYTLVVYGGQWCVGAYNGTVTLTDSKLACYITVP